MQKPITTGPQTLTAAGPFTGVLDTSALTGDYTIEVELLDISPNTTARVAIEDATAFTGDAPDNLPVAVWHFQGPGLLTGPAQAAGIQQEPRNYSARRFEVRDTRIGAANTKLRATLVSINAPSDQDKTITLNARLAA